MTSDIGLAVREGVRPHRSQDEIASILREHRLSGLSLLAFARQRGLCYSTLLRWRRRVSGLEAEAVDVRPRVPVAGFVPVELEESPPGREFVLSWEPQRRLRIPPGFDPAELRQLLEILGVRP
jgi:hypothetical protein